MSFKDDVRKELSKDPRLECLKILAGNDKDHVRLRNGIGFDKRDFNIGNALANLDALGPNQFDKAGRIIKKYEKQLPPTLYLEALDAKWEDYYHGNSEEKYENERGIETEVDGVRFKIPVKVNKDGRDVYDFAELAKEIKKAFNFEYLKDRKNRAVSLVYYDPKSGIYRKDGEDKVRYILEHSLGNSAVVNIKNEVVQHLKDQGFEYLDRWLENSNPHIAVNNGIINLRKYVEEGDSDKCLEPFTPEYHSFSKLDVNYDPHAPCDLLINHLNLVIPDSSDLDRFQKFIGSFLETDGYGHQKIFIAYGRGGSGKTVTLRLFSKFFGIENISSKSF
ncbi:MAG: hypothetical protein QXU18_12810, partial [Thermoplasmatales archaeon]